MIADLLMPGARSVRTYAESLLKDIKSNQFARKPQVNEHTIELNHPAFNYGHLGLYPLRVSKLLQLDQTRVIPPQKFDVLFNAGAVCKDDPEGTIYPSMEIITSHFLSSHDALFEMLPRISDAQLLAPHPEERLLSRFPTVGSFIAYLLTAHANSHLGQVSAWRRCIGLGPV
jgi:hypothetical protein